MKTLTLLCLLMVVGCREVKKPSPAKSVLVGQVTDGGQMYCDYASADQTCTVRYAPESPIKDSGALAPGPVILYTQVPLKPRFPERVLISGFRGFTATHCRQTFTLSDVRSQYQCDNGKTIELVDDTK